MEAAAGQIAALFRKFLALKAAMISLSRHFAIAIRITGPVFRAA